MLPKPSRRALIAGLGAASLASKVAALTPAQRVVILGGKHVVPFNPASLFGSSDRGLVVDATSAANLFQSSGGSTPVTSPGNPIGYISDLSPNNNPAKQATSSKQPLWLGSPRTVGAELVTNGAMVSDASGWTLGTGWAWSASGQTAKTAGTAANLSQNVSLMPGQAYILWFSVTATAGSVTPKISGGTGTTFPARSANATAYEPFIATSGDNTIEFDASSTFAGTIGLVSIVPVETWTNMGAYANGVGDLLQTASINMSASHKATVVISSYQGWRAADYALFDVGSYNAQTAGSLQGFYLQNAYGRIANGTALNNVEASDDPVAAPSGSIPLTEVNSFLLDFTQATVSAQIQVRSRGLLPTQTPTSNTVADHALPSAAISLLSSANGLYPWFGGLYRAIIINRTLTATELAEAEAWVKQGIVYCCDLGDSTSAGDSPSYASGLNLNFPTVGLIGGCVVGSAGYAYPGDKIADQQTKLTNGGSTNIATVQAGFIQVGLNDINTYAGVSESTATIIANLQTLVNTYNSLKPPGSKTYICGLTPCRAWLGLASGQQAAAYQAWLDVNASIAGTPNAGFNAITDVDARIMGHVAALNDGSGNLAQQFNGNYDGVHLSNQGRFVVAQYRRAQLEADGLLLTQ